MMELNVVNTAMIKSDVNINIIYKNIICADYTFNSLDIVAP